jgi:hypothetical protein
MKSLHRIAFGLAVIAFLILVVVPKFAIHTSANTQTVYHFQTVVAVPCGQTGNGGPPTDLCVGSNGASVESVLDSYSSQGYALLLTTTSVNWNNTNGAQAGGAVAYTLRK